MYDRKQTTFSLLLGCSAGGATQSAICSMSSLDVAGLAPSYTKSSCKPFDETLSESFARFQVAVLGRHISGVWAHQLVLVALCCLQADV